MTHECSQQVQHGSGLHLQYPQYQLTPGLQVTGGGSLEVASGIQIASGSGTPLHTAQILNPQLQSVTGTAFPSQLLLQTPQLGKLVFCMQPCLFAVCLLQCLRTLCICSTCKVDECNLLWGKRNVLNKNNSKSEPGTNGCCCVGLIRMRWSLVNKCIALLEMRIQTVKWLVQNHILRKSVPCVK